MNKKQKLRNAVILGLLMSSVTASSAWAEHELKPVWTIGTDYDILPALFWDHDVIIKNITAPTYGVQYGIWSANGYITTKNIDSLSVYVDANRNAESAVGIFAGQKIMLVILINELRLI